MVVARIDRVENNRECRTIPTLTYHVMLEQDAVAATVLERHGADWISRLPGAADTLDLPGVGVAIPLADLYEGLDLSAPSADD